MLTVNATLVAEVVAPPEEGSPGDDRFVNPPLLRSYRLDPRHGSPNGEDALARLVIQGNECGRPAALLRGDPARRLRVVRLNIAAANHPYARSIEELMSAIGVLDLWHEANNEEPFEGVMGAAPLQLLSGRGLEVGARYIGASSFQPKADGWVVGELRRLERLLSSGVAPSYRIPSKAVQCSVDRLTQLFARGEQGTRLSPWTGRPEAFVVEHRLPWLPLRLADLIKLLLPDQVEMRSTGSAG